MTPMLTKKLRFYLRLQYPVRIIAGEDGLVGSLPDLPGCSVTAESAPAVYSALELARRSWLAERISSGVDIPKPNSFLSPEESESAAPPCPEAYAQREATPF
jgi:predicted RNase H-like HicB family nuclease